MIHVIVDQIRSRISTFSWLPNPGTLVEIAHLQIADTNQIKQVPLSCRIEEQCGVDPSVNIYIPDSNKSVVSFFVQTSGDALLGTAGAKGRALEYRFQVRFLIWVNGDRVKAIDGTTQCAVAEMMAAAITAKVYGRYSINGTTFAEQNLAGMNIDRVQVATKSPTVFGNFSFVNEGIAKGLWLPPNDYIGIDISGTYQLSINCITDIDTAIQITEPTC